jgi:hypothetical protein
MSLRILPVLLLPTLLGVSSTHAQQKPPLSLDASVGWGTGYTSGRYLEPGSRHGDGDAVLAWRLRPAWSGTFVVAASASAPCFFGCTSLLLLCVPTTPDDCMPGIPHFKLATALAGWESENAVLRILTGPAYVRDDGVSAAGWQGRLDLAPFSVGPMALVASGRATLVPNFHDNAFQLLALSLGLRIGH